MKKLWLLLVLLPTFAFAGKLPDVTQPDNPDWTSIPELIDIAVKATGYPKPAELPKLVNLSQDEMRIFICGEQAKNCGVYGVYFDLDVIYVRYDVRDAKTHDHLLYHEIVHWLQHHSGQFDLNNCNDTIRREMEAYQMENVFIMQVQNDFTMLIPPAMSCDATKFR